jgi:ElaB/YqjD/DUF883 family membrane-anchored ribosome-binding protein
MQSRRDSVTDPVRDEYVIKIEIDEAQVHLEQNLGELKDAILEKVDVKARIEHVIDDAEDKAMDYVVRAREIAIDLYAQGRTLVRDRPMLVVGVIGGVALIAGAALGIRHHLRSDAPD